MASRCLPLALLWVAFPPMGFWPLIAMNFVPMLVAQHRVLPARASSLAPAITLGGLFGAMFAPVFAGLPEITSRSFVPHVANPGDMTLDPFCGCGTAVAAAQKLGRRWIGIDITALAVALQRYRLSRCTLVFVSMCVESRKMYRVLVR